MNYFLPKKNLQVLTVLILIILISACSENVMNSEIVLIKEGEYMYPAKVTNADTESDLQIQVYIFNDTVRGKVGDQIPADKVAVKRLKPPKGWGTRQVALQYLWNEEWIYAEDVTEFEDHYIVPTNAKENRKIELKHIRFPIPVQR